MKTYNIALIPGDGIGHEVIPEGLRIIQIAAEITGSFSCTFESFPFPFPVSLISGC